jgi:hypothetical protein
MRSVAARERLKGDIATLRGRLGVLAAEREAARERAAPRDVEAWLAFVLLVVIVAGAGVWLGVAARAVHAPPTDCLDS